ncbi:MULTISPECIES: RsmB/NOP family class I SAM-dependent RNA methyltransferase [unclassified Roseitalea]|uniref:RsmB/NOP family class I SAM-dependent RNA methyltransferase n=1 Tax=unclassified Roseitalea TaxID=2639107 RepID=UPI00273D89F6|nr:MULTISPECIES: RsmB/NOP family class I SAM-dependent RNA methyltransferase [unclassified Roseitalea]
MRLGGRIAAAIDVLADIDTNHRPASVALADWGRAHRFAGSGDRAAIGNIVYDALRRRASIGYRMDDDGPLALAFGALLEGWSLTPEAIAEALAGDRFAPEPPMAALAAAATCDMTFADAHVEADVPAWCADLLADNFGEEWIDEAKAFAERPPLDLRVNTLKADRDKVQKALARTGARPTAIARHGLRITPPGGAGRLPNVQAEPAFQKGWFEIQDEGSQIVADLVFAQPGEQVFDLCAGAGGKTLALAAAMQNKGQVHAFDADKQRLAPIFDRLRRAGTRNVQVHAADADLSPLDGRCDRVVVDAPCTGSGTWRRNPDAKWRLTQGQLDRRCAEQAAILDAAARYVRPGGYLCYITCSVFLAENEEQVYRFGDRHAGWSLLSAGEVWQDLFGFDKPQPWSSDLDCVTLTPRATQTDGFFFAVLQRAQGNRP